MLNFSNTSINYTYYYVKITNKVSQSFHKSTHIFLSFKIKRDARAKHEAPHDKGEGKSFIMYSDFLPKIPRTIDSLNYLYTNPRYKLDYLCTRPDPSPPANFITSSIDTKLKSPSIECFKQDAATAISIVC